MAESRPLLPPRVWVLGAAAFAFFFLPSAAGFFADWWWFAEVGYQPIFVRAIVARSTLGLAVGAIVFAAIWWNIRLAMRAMPERAMTITTREGVEIALPSKGQVQSVAILAALAAAFLTASYASAQWLSLLTWWNATSFAVSDPVLGRDAGFYVFTLPLLDLLRNVLMILIASSAIASGVVYVMGGELALTPFGLRLGSRVWRHASWLAAALFAVLALDAWLSRAHMIVAPAGLIQGARYADVFARMPAALVLALAALAGSVLAMIASLGGRRRLLAVAAIAYGVVLAGGQIYAAILQRVVVSPNEQARETPFIEHNIRATRAAFGLDRIVERELSGDAELTRADIARNRETLDNVRLWDHQPLLETFGQIQEIRTYYDFVAVDNDRYEIGGQLRQVMLSARELNAGALPNRTWINERLVFTHGHGLTLGPVNQVTSEGLPVLFVRDLPPVSSADLTVTQPSIYFGELSNDYVIARTRAREFHYPKGDDNVFTDYDGSGGVPLDSLWRKLLFAVHFRAYQILLSDDISNESRLLFDRSIRRRAAKIAPFLSYDDDPYLVVNDGRLYWMLDAYTTSGRYPYSTAALANLNYIRNSVKIVIDAYHGTTTFYLAEPADPIVTTLGRVFPSLLKPLEDMPEGLRRHIRYPEQIFEIQSAVYSTYHMTNPAVFYNKEDQWEVPAIDSRGEAQRMLPYYTIMKLPGETRAEFIQMLPFTPRSRDNLASWLVARSDRPHYGQLLAFQFPKQKLIFGPRQVVARINQNQVISPQITLWSQQGSEVIQGTLMVIPVEESLIYVRPLNLRAQAGRIPELTRVIVAYQNRIVMEPTLDAALTRVFGDTAAPAALPAAPTPAPAPAAPSPGAPAPAAGPMAKLAAEANATYQRALEAQKAGDWAKYGEEIRRLGEILQRMQR
jgi:uncharacterized membrane protein (UPF0182 family)